MMEEVVDYSTELGNFDQVALLEVTMLFIDQLIKSGRKKQALALLNKVVSLRTKKLGNIHGNSLVASHLLPFLLIKLKKYPEAVKCAQEVLSRERKTLGQFSSFPLEIESTLVRALYWVGQKKKSKAICN